MTFEIIKELTSCVFWMTALACFTYVVTRESETATPPQEKSLDELEAELPDGDA